MAHLQLQAKMAHFQLQAMAKKKILKKKKALLIGLNYPGQIHELRGCINDVQRMKECLINRYGFSEEDIVVLIDTEQAHTIPTANNIRSALSSLIGSANPGDVLFIQFSGHGDRVRAVPEDSNDTGFIEFVVAADGDCFTDYEFRAIIDMVPRGCWITIIADCCHSGGLIEGAKEQIGGDSTKKGHPNSRSKSVFEFGNFPHGVYSFVNDRSLSFPMQFDMKQETGADATSKVKFVLDKSHHEGHDEFSEKGHELEESIVGLSKSSLPDRGILFSACQSYQKAKEVSFSENSDEVCGVFSNAIQAIIKETNGGVTNRELVWKARKIFEKKGFRQKPGLYCNDHYADAPFLCVDLMKTQRVNKFLVELLVLFFMIFENINMASSHGLKITLKVIWHLLVTKMAYPKS